MQNMFFIYVFDTHFIVFINVFVTWFIIHFDRYLIPSRTYIYQKVLNASHDVYIF